MQDQPLLISSLIEFAARHHGDAEVVSRRVEGDLHRSTYRPVAARSRLVAGALDRWNLGFSDRVATLVWNGYRHLELYFGVSGSGRVLHTLNPRLAPDQVVWIANHAEDQVLCFDMTFLPLIKAIWKQCGTVKHWVALCEAEALPADTGIEGLVSYEAWIAPESTDYAWPSFDERSAASLCYTSGTTGNPKGALYSHRSTVLHAFGGALPDALNLSARDSILPVVPMFHVNAWGLPYVAAMTGAKLVFPGPALDGKDPLDAALTPHGLAGVGEVEEGGHREVSDLGVECGAEGRDDRARVVHTTGDGVRSAVELDDCAPATGLATQGACNRADRRAPQPRRGQALAELGAHPPAPG
jgi:fatty-acyl-CoA synthase